MTLETLSWSSARNMCIVKTLAKLGHYPTRTTEKEAWFLSPLRSETQASLSVSLNKNLWYDYGEGKGGNIIDLILALRNCSPYDALRYLDQNDSFSFCPEGFLNEEKHISIQVQRIKTIVHPGLQEYLNFRKIPLVVARKYCKEVWYRLKGKTFFSIGLQNNAGGWELRNKFYKSSTSPKSYTYYKRSSSTLLVTEGMFDFLSLNVLEGKLIEASDYLILNSLSFIREIKFLLAKYKKVLLYLDNDSAGRKATRELLFQFNNVSDRSDSYSNFTDLNEWLQHEKRKRC